MFENVPPQGPTEPQPADPVTAYALAVGTGQIVAGPYVRAACRRHLEDLQTGAERGLFFDVEAADRVIRFFRALTIESKRIGPDGGVESRVVPFILQPWQVFIVGSLMGWKSAEGVRRFRRAYVEIGKGAGKALALDTPISTPDGWREMRDLQPRDRVFDETGEACTVTAVSPVMTGRPCYEVDFSDGCRIVADADHLWATRVGSGSAQLRTTQDIAATLDRTHFVDRRHIVRCAPASSVPVKCISVDSPSRMYLAGREMVPTHNSPLAAGLGLYFLCGKGVMIDDGQIYSAATSRDQAYILFRAAIRMFLRSRVLDRKLRAKGHKFETISQLTHKISHSVFKPIASENQGQSGTIVYLALIDEVHEHPDDTVIEMMRAGTKGNQDALLFAITNSGFDNNSVCGREHDYSVRVVTGVEPNDAWFAYVAALDSDDEPFEDESCWIKANPNLGVSIYPAYIREQVAEAKGMPSKEGLVRRLNFCQWTGSDASAIPLATWRACQAIDGKAFDPDELLKAGVPCFGGLDLSRTRDLTALSLNWLLENKKDQWRFATKTWFWTPKATLRERSKTDRAPYELWVEQGHMEAVPGPRITYAWLAHALLQLNAKYHPVKIGCDQYGLEQLNEALKELGGELPAVVHPQGFNRRAIGKHDENKPKGQETGAEDIVLWMPDSINKLEAALLEQRIAVAVNPVMSMCAAGVVYEQNRTGHRMFAKDKASSRIDGMVSLAMSVGIATASETGVDLDAWLAGAVMR